MLATIFGYIAGNKYVIGIVLVLTVLGYIQYLRSSNASLRTEKAALELSVETQKETIANLQADIKKVRESEKVLIAEKTALEKEKKDLDDTLYREKNKKKSLEELALKKTTLIEKLVNKATKEVFDCFVTISKGGDC